MQVRLCCWLLLMPIPRAWRCAGGLCLLRFALPSRWSPPQPIQQQTSEHEPNRTDDHHHHHHHTTTTTPTSRTDGVDIDPTLVRRASVNAARLRESLQQRMRAATAPAARPRGYDPAIRALGRRIKALSRVSFAAGNWLEAPCPAGAWSCCGGSFPFRWVGPR